MTTTPPAVAEALGAVLTGQTAAALESDHLDFKTVGRSVDDTLVDLAEAAACFANAGGGHIVVGVADKLAGSEALVGCDLDAARTQRRIYDVTKPSLIVSVDDLTVHGVRLLVITVPKSPDVHQVRGRATERVGTACEPMSATRIAAVVSERRGDDWSAEDSGVATAAASPRAVDDARRLLAEASDSERQRWATLSDVDLFRRLGVRTDNGTLTNGGALLFGGVETGPLVAYTHRRTRSGELTTNQVLTGPGLTAVLRSLELLDGRVERTPINLPNGQQLFIADLPDAAVREVVVNAVMHRDYRSNAAVQVEHAATRLSVTSPGGFVFGVTPRNILTVTSRTRNPSLAGAIRHLGLAEAAGVGVDRMYAEMAKVGHQPPVFESDGFRVTVTLNGGAPNTAVTRFVASLPPERRSDPDTLLVMLALLTKRTVTADDLAATLQKDVAEVELILREAAVPRVGFIERTRESASLRAGVYRLRDHAIAQLGPAVTYRRRVSDDTDRKLIEIVREVGQINSKLVRTVLDVDTPTASRILADLVEREILVKTSEAQRGPSVTYGAGAHFPAPARQRRRSNGRGRTVSDE